jgi:predicted Fe-S protein YdhL (DUF1289 family)
MKEKSPCINICRYNDFGLCVGCLRTKEEISNWSYYSDEEKRKVKEEIIKRRLDKGENYYEGFN